ncbi:MAG: MoxR family ATPase [Burkholderiales bacterium]|nr:MoxR family ATPase [Burkholderiales bacterium]
MNARAEFARQTPTVGSNQLAFRNLRQHLQQKIIGQEHLVERLLISLLADGHLLVEGAPGLAKTTAIKELAASLQGDFRRVQFTPDLLPGDLTGTDVYRPETGDFHFQPGPLFHNIILADEINRAPAKVQSALLEGMGEKQITVGRQTYVLPSPFMVMATQNPIEHEGTYPLPEAQLDRFLMYVRIGYPDAKAERGILALARRAAGESLGAPPPSPIEVSKAQIFAARSEVLAIHMAEPVEEYLVQLVLASRNPSRYKEALARRINFGASPRATIALDRCARAHAWLKGRDYATPEDVQTVAHDVLRHRILVSFEAEAEGISADDVIGELLQLVPAA